MRCSDCKNFRVQEQRTKKADGEKASGICTINNSACNPEDGCMTGLFDKTGAI